MLLPPLVPVVYHEHILQLPAGHGRFLLLKTFSAIQYSTVCSRRQLVLVTETSRQMHF